MPCTYYLWRKEKLVNLCMSQLNVIEQQRPLLAHFDANRMSGDPPPLSQFYYCRLWLSDIQVGQERHQTAVSCDQGDGGLYVSAQLVHEATMQCLKDPSGHAIGIFKVLNQMFQEESKVCPYCVCELLFWLKVCEEALGARNHACDVTKGSAS